MEAETEVLEGSPPAARWTERVFCLALIVLYVRTVARSVQIPNVYAVGHWLHNFDFGFITRGLVGELVQPIIVHKANDEIFRIVTILSLVIFTVLSAIYLWSAFEIGRGGIRRKTPVLSIACALVFVSSPFVVLSAHLVGYLDHMVVIATFACIVLVGRGRLLAAGLSSAVTLLVHEMHALAGFPVIVFAAWLKLRGGDRPDAPSPVPAIAKLLVPVASVAVVIVFSSLTQSQESVDALRAQMSEARVISPRWVEMSTYHLDHGFAENFRSQSAMGLERLLDPVTLRSTAPSALFLLLATSLLLRLQGWGRFSPLYVAATLSPLLMHWVAWDRSRISTLVVFNAFAGLFASHLLAPQRASGEPTSRFVRTAIAAAAAGTMIASFHLPVMLMGGEIDGKGLFELRSAPVPEDPPVERRRMLSPDVSMSPPDTGVARRRHAREFA